MNERRPDLTKLTLKERRREDAARSARSVLIGIAL